MRRLPGGRKLPGSLCFLAALFSKHATGRNFTYSIDLNNDGRMDRFVANRSSRSIVTITMAHSTDLPIGRYIAIVEGTGKWK